MMTLKVREFKAITSLDGTYFRRTQGEVLAILNDFLKTTRYGPDGLDIRIINVETIFGEEMEGFEGYRIFFLLG